LEADLLGRRAIGIELNPYALVVSKAKFDRTPLKEEIQWLKGLQLDVDSINLEDLSQYIRQFYHEQTLKEMFALKNEIIREHKIFLLGCLLGIAHGHRPQHLSAYTGYIVPYKKAKVPPKRYRAVIPRMIQKVYRMYDRRGQMRGDVMFLEEERRSEVQSFRAYHPMFPHVYKNYPKGFEMQELMVPIFQKGELLYEMPKVQDIRNYTVKNLEDLDAAYKRFQNPHTYHVSLSPSLFAIKQRLLRQTAKTARTASQS